MHRLVFLLLVLLHPAYPALAQPFARSAPSLHFTTADGLAGQQVRSFLEDSRGYIWIGTQTGLSRFDGRTIRSFALPPIVGGHPIATMVEAPDGSIWLRAGAEVLRFDGRAATALPLTPAFWASQPPRLWALVEDQLPALLRERFACLQAVGSSFKVCGGGGDTVVIADLERRQVYRIAAGQCAVLPLTVELSAEAGTNPEFLALRDRDRWYSWQIDRFVESGRYDPSRDTALVLGPLAPVILYAHDRQRRAVVWRRDGRAYHRMPTPVAPDVFRVHKDSHARLHVATDNGYTVMFLNGMETFALPPRVKPRTVLPGPDGSVWFGADGAGLFRLAASGRLLTQVPLPEPGNTESQLFPGRCQGANGELLWGGYRGFYSFQAGKLHWIRLKESIEALAWHPGRNCYLAGGEALYVVEPGSQSITATYPLPADLTRGRGLIDLEVLPDGTIWAAGAGGLGRFASPERPPRLFLPGRSGLPFAEVNALRPDPDGGLWIGGEGGLAWRPPGRDTFYHVLAGVIVGTVNDLVALPGRRLAVVLASALAVLDVDRPEQPRVWAWLDRTSGFELQETGENGSWFDGRYLWVPANDGLLRWDVAAQRPVSGPAPALFEAVDGQALLLSNGAAMTVTESSARIRFACPGAPGASLAWQYMLNEAPAPVAVHDREFVVTGLRPGRNELILRAIVPGEREPLGPAAAMALNVELPLYRYPAFPWAAGALSVSLLGGGLLIRHSRARRRQQRERQFQEQLYRTQLRTVQAQLNPHIFFNFLTSLQNSIANRSREAAGEHLLSIARLLREFLELTYDGEQPQAYPFAVIPLQREIEFLREYLQLEAMQSSPPFAFTFDTTGLPNPARVFLPPLLIQPLVENAVHHGLRPLDRAGHVRVEFRAVGRELEVLVDDDGVGLATGATPAVATAPRYRSRGTQLVREGLALYTQLGYPASLEVGPRPGGGTRARLRFPLLGA
jgi:signal transduction histidine kinase